jgi:hypothetical protein
VTKLFRCNDQLGRTSRLPACYYGQILEHLERAGSVGKRKVSFNHKTKLNKQQTTNNQQWEDITIASTVLLDSVPPLEDMVDTE